MFSHGNLQPLEVVGARKNVAREGDISLELSLFFSSKYFQAPATRANSQGSYQGVESVNNKVCLTNEL